MPRRVVRLLALRLFVSAATLSLASSHVLADATAKESFAGYTKYLWYRADYTVNADGTHVENQSWAKRVLTYQGVSQANQASVSYSNTLQTAVILEAYTLKQDGRRIDVPAGNFQVETNTGMGKAAPMFSDIRTKTVAFPDVAVGDTVVISYKLTQKEALFPGNFSMLHTFSKFQVYDDVQIKLSAPHSLDLHVYARDVQGGEAPSTDGRRNWSWSYRNQSIATPESNAVSSLDYGPLIVATTFKDYGALATAYNARAKARSQPTDRIRKLADQLTENAHTPREQAKALYDWVAQNVKYAENRVGVGSVVPHDAEAVLKNRLGDCKDHAGLFEALLSAKGIASTPVLINTESAFTLPEAASIGAFDHTITYVPALDLYADSTSEYTPFGSLPWSDVGKPVVHTAEFKGIRRTPTTDAKTNRSLMSSLLRIHSDGAADGETKFEATGVAATWMRYAMTYLQPNLEDTMVRRGLASQGFRGSGTIDRGNPRDLTDAYSYRVKYKIGDAINLPGPGAIYVLAPYGGTGVVSNFARSAIEPDRTVNFQCAAAFARDEFMIHFPRNVKVLSIPKNVELKSKYATYRATYQSKDGTVAVVREIVDRTPGPVCTPAFAAEYKPFAVGMMKDLRAQILYE
jgi:transglutaminase-like putative cysteine protease